MRADTARTVSVEITRPAKESVQNGVIWRSTGALRVVEPDPTAIQLERGHRSHRRGERVGDDRVHPEEAHQDTQDGQAGDGGDAGHQE